jgi:hypothetical protein
MNRIVLLGVAIFFALVGIALVGGENKASAFFGRGGGCACNGCNGCHGGHGCHSRCHGGCHSRCHGGCHKSRCHGRCHGSCCSSSCNGGCYGSYEKEAGPVQAPASPEKQAPVQGPVK